MAYLHDLIAPGIMLPFGGATAPNGWLLCHGQADSRSTFATLFAAIGTAFGTGDGSTTFNVPDLRGRVPAGKDDMGGTSASRLTNTGTGNSGINGSVLGAAGGADRQTLTQAQMPIHSHGPQSGVVTNYIGNAASGSGGSLSTTIAGGLASASLTGNTGGGKAHAIVQPTIIMNYVIKV